MGGQQDTIFKELHFIPVRYSSKKVWLLPASNLRNVILSFLNKFELPQTQSIKRVERSCLINTLTMFLKHSTLLKVSKTADKFHHEQSSAWNQDVDAFYVSYTVQEHSAIPTIPKMLAWVTLNCISKWCRDTRAESTIPSTYWETKTPPYKQAATHLH